MAARLMYCLTFMVVISAGCNRVSAPPQQRNTGDSKTGESGGQRGTVADRPAGVEPAADTDNDSLDDATEEKHGTSPHHADTDGDGYTDFEELVEHKFDASNNPYRYNPLIADVPKIEFKILSVPDVSYNLFEGQSEDEGISVTRSESSRASVSSSSTLGSSRAVEERSTITHEAGGEVSLSPLPLGAIVGHGGGASAHYSYSDSKSDATTNETNFSWTATQMEENERALQRSQDVRKGKSTEKTGGTIKITVGITNHSNMTVTVRDLHLTTLIVDPHNPQDVQPISGLRYAASEIGQWPDTPLTGGQTSGPFTFINSDLNLATVDRILGSSRGLVVRPETFDIVHGASNISFNERFTNIKSKTAMVTIDFGEKRPAETYLVATHCPGYDGLPAGKAIERLHLDYEVGSVPWQYVTRTGKTAETRLGKTKNGVTRIFDVATDSAQGGYWVVTHTWNNGREVVSKTYHPLVDACDLQSIILKADHALRLVYISDQDRDGLGIRTEKLLCTRYSQPEDWDSDGDGISDQQELRDGTDPTRDNSNMPPVFENVVFDVRGNKVIISADVSDPDDPLAGTTLHWQTNGQDSSSTSSDPHHLQAEITLPLGGHALKLVAVDARGMDGVYEENVEIVFPSQGLLRYYPISKDDLETAGRDSYGNAGVLDRSEHEQHAKYTLASFATDRFGAGEQCADLQENSGSDYYGSIWCPPIEFTGGSFTMAAWVNVWSLQSQRIVGRADWFQLFSGSGSQVVFGLPAGNSGGIKDGIGVEEPGREPERNRWCFYVGVCEYDAESETSMLRLYRDGEMVAQQRLDVMFESPNQPSMFVIGNHLRRPRDGAWPEDPSRTRVEADKFQGKIDDVRVYDRALTTAEVKALYYERGYEPESN
jgi:hypothetical protein